MKILFVTFFRRGFGGGDNQIAWDLAETLVKHGEEVTFVCLGDKSEITNDKGLKIFSIEAEGKESVSIPALTGKTIMNLYSYLDTYKPDIIHAHTDDPLSMLIQIWASFRKVHFLYTTHVLPSKAGGFSVSDFLPFVRSLSNSAMELNIRAFLNNCTALVAINKTSYDDLIKFGYKGDVRVIRNGRDLSLYEGLKSPLEIQQKRYNLLFVGLLNDRKNQIYLIKVLQHLPSNYVLTLVGEAMTAEYKNKLVEYVRANKLGSRVYFVPRVEHHEIPKLFEEAHLFVSASKMEVQSLVILEALAAGRPIIGLENETVSELIANKENGFKLSASSSPELFAHKVEETIKNKDLYSRMIVQSKKTAEEFDIHKVAYELKGYYSDLLVKGYPKKEKAIQKESGNRYSLDRFSYVKNFPQVAWSAVDRYLYAPYKRVTKQNLFVIVAGLGITLTMVVFYIARSIRILSKVLKFIINYRRKNRG
jgi:glycosyltransferase involved in cell wall biosynthesis